MNNGFLSSSSSSSSSDEVQEIANGRPRAFPERRNPYTEYEDNEFKMRFRLSKACVDDIIQLIGHHLEPMSGRNNPITAMNQLLITLRFYATGSLEMCAGDHFNVSKASVCRIVAKVSHHIALLRPHFVEMPRSRNELNKVQNDFYGIACFPGVLGAIDCSHIRIQSPGGENGEMYRNHKGWFSINTQAVCDAGLKFRDVVARWPGGAPDSTIFNDSFLRARLENNEYPDCYLLGDNGYACEKYLLTPLLTAQSDAEIAYNHAQKRTQGVTDKAFGALKRRFPCLSLGMRVSLDKVLAIIVATMVLHNIAIEMADAEPEVDPEIEIPIAAEPRDVLQNAANENVAVRTALINTVFSRHKSFLSDEYK